MTGARPMPDSDDYPGLAIVARQAFDRAITTLPPDVKVAMLLAFHPGEGGGLAWVAGVDRESAIEMIVEWLAHQVDEGRAEVVRSAFAKWLGTKL